MNDQIYKNWRKDVGTDYETTRKLVDEDYTRANISRNTEDELVEMNEKLTGATTMNEQPEALLIAELLERDGLNPALTIRMDAAAELRRLHAENERLREKCEELGSDKGTWYRMAELHCSTIDRLKASMREAVEAEREACVAIAEKELGNTAMLTSMPPKSSAAWNIAAAIRARGEQGKQR